MIQSRLFDDRGSILSVIWPWMILKIYVHLVDQNRSKSTQILTASLCLHVMNVLVDHGFESQQALRIKRDTHILMRRVWF